MASKIGFRVAVGPHIALILQRIAQPVGQCELMGQISWRIKWAHTGGCTSWLPGCCGPTRMYRQEWRICIKVQREYFSSAANLLPINSVGPHVVVVRQRIAQPMGQRDSMGQISWSIKWAHAGTCAERFQHAMGQLDFILRSGASASKTATSIWLRRPIC